MTNLGVALTKKSPIRARNESGSKGDLARLSDSPARWVANSMVEAAG